MRVATRTTLLFLLAAGLFPIAAWQERLTREGAYWVQIVRGTEAAAAGGRLKVATSGRISIKGADTETVLYSFTKRVPARTEAEARRLLGQFLVRSSRQSDLTLIEVMHGAGHAATELTVTAPRNLRELQVETRGGAVDATGFDGSLHASTGGGKIRLNRIGGNVTTRTAGGDVWMGEVKGAVRCLSAGGSIRAESIGGNARFETAGGTISVRDVLGKVFASTAGGDIQIQRAASSVAVNTAGGEIHVGSAGGDVVAGSLGGPIYVGASAGVRCETGGGAIQLANASGYVQASTQVGNIVASLARAAALGESFLSTGAGDITLWVPASLGLAIQALNRTVEGPRIVSDFPGVTVRREGRLTVAEGSINGGGPLLRLSGAGGTIYIKRQQ